LTACSIKPQLLQKARAADEFHKHVDELEITYGKAQREFDKQAYLKNYDVYEAIYPRLFKNSFLVSACALFENETKKICTVIKEECCLPIDWGDMEGSVPTRTRKFLGLAGVVLKDDAPGSFHLLISNRGPGNQIFLAAELWLELESYFRVRNCLAHHGGAIQRLRTPEKVKAYAIRKKDIVGKCERTRTSIRR
jgi:hypothetical protein